MELTKKCIVYGLHQLLRASGLNQTSSSKLYDKLELGSDTRLADVFRLFR